MERETRHNLQTALEAWDEVEKRKQAFINENNSDDGDPKCGYFKWDETLADFREELESAGDALAEAIREALS